MSKMKMELVWHNCKTCPPHEVHNECLYVTDGAGVFEVEWYAPYWYNYDGRELRSLDENKEDFWWADIDQTTAAFFKAAGLYKPKFL